MGWLVITTLAPAFTACCSTAIVAIAVVTTPVTTLAGSPAFRPSTVSGFHGTPIRAVMRSISSFAVSAAEAVWPGANGAAAAAAARVVNSRRERCVIGVPGIHYDARPASDTDSGPHPSLVEDA